MDEMQAIYWEEKMGSDEIYTPTPTPCHQCDSLSWGDWCSTDCENQFVGEMNMSTEDRI